MKMFRGIENIILYAPMYLINTADSHSFHIFHSTDRIGTESVPGYLKSINRALLYADTDHELL